MSSVPAGCRALSGDAAGIMIALGDMPDLRPGDYRGLADAFFAAGAGNIVVPFHGDARGNPVIVPIRFLGEIASGTLNAGCKRLIETRADDVLRVPVSSAAHVRDIDTPADYQGLAPDHS